MEVGDIVERLSDVYDVNSRNMIGIITRKYSKPKMIYGPDLILGPYPELYSVQWFNGRHEKGFLPHGITLLTNPDE